jgi:hypothetical protein
MSAEQKDPLHAAVLLWPDYLVVAIYFAFVIVIGIWVRFHLVRTNTVFL